MKNCTNFVPRPAEFVEPRSTNRQIDTLNFEARGDDGFEMLSISFPDINECEFSVDENGEGRLPLTRHNRHNCTQPHSKCVNVKGSYKCE